MTTTEGITQEPTAQAQKRFTEMSEKDFEDEFCGCLDASGMFYERQKQTANGIIDLFIYGQPPSIIELKRDATPYSIREAVTQLKFYAAAFKGKPELYIAVKNGPIPDDLKQIIHEFGIREISIERDPHSMRMTGWHVPYSEYSRPVAQ